MAYIFKTGQCTRGALYDVMINQLIAAGWANISSNTLADGDVLYSTGVNADKALYIQFSPYIQATSAANDTAYSSRTTSYYNWKVRLINKYTPGVNNASGVFSEPNRVWAGIYPMNRGVSAWNNVADVPNTVLVNYKIYVDQSKIIFATKASDVYTAKWNIFYIGLPDTLYCKAENNRGLLYTASFNANIFNSSAYMTNYVDAIMGDIGDAYYGVNLATITPTKSPNLNNKYFLSDIYTMSDTYGMIGKLDGIYSLTYSNINSEDIISYNGENYCIIDTYQVQTYNGFPTRAIAVRV